MLLQISEARHYLAVNLELAVSEFFFRYNWTIT